MAKFTVSSRQPKDIGYIIDNMNHQSTDNCISFIDFQYVNCSYNVN